MTLLRFLRFELASASGRRECANTIGAAIGTCVLALACVISVGSFA